MKTVHYTIWKRDGNGGEEYIAPGYKEEYDTYEEAEVWDAEARHIKRDFPINNLED